MFFYNTVERLVRSKIDSICYLMKINCFMSCILYIAQINSFLYFFQIDSRICDSCKVGGKYIVVFGILPLVYIRSIYLLQTLPSGMVGVQSYNCIICLS